ncbi:hypothetical protein IGI04_042454 [Brassica rapa subsp. trilocularis]|uniref:Uncharacterized protein n=1 Tax=Brassica rapa subsp. trilocularis TaxID=1813537 RepID=A0ABQ7KIA6_BRACM|nr:hypothetical protein IGI04_042454 [Brassica rapa subsp. trilocularis]
MRSYSTPGDCFHQTFVSKSTLQRYSRPGFDWNGRKLWPRPKMETGIQPDVKTKKPLLVPNWETGNQPDLKVDNTFFIPTPMRFINLLVILHHFMYPNQASYKEIHPGLIGTTKKLCYSQTGKLESPDLKVG